MSGAEHRLAAGGAEIDDRQPAMAKPDVTFDPVALAIRTAVGKGVGHPLEEGQGDGGAVEV